MNRTQRQGEFVVSAAVVAVFSAFWVIAFAMSDPSEFQLEETLGLISSESG